MNNNVDALFKLLVPAIFLVLWALNQLFNKENQAQPGRPGSSLGPRPGSPNAPRPAPGSTRPEIADPKNPYAANRSAPPAGKDDEIVILRSETVRPPAGSSRRNARSRTSRTSQSPNGVRSGRSSSEPRRESTGTRSQSVPIPISPSQSTPSGSPLLIGVAAPLSAADVQGSMSDRERIREAILINELLQPPLALRRRRRAGGR